MEYPPLPEPHCRHRQRRGDARQVHETTDQPRLFGQTVSGCLAGASEHPESESDTGQPRRAARGSRTAAAARHCASGNFVCRGGSPVDGGRAAGAFRQGCGTDIPPLLQMPAAGTTVPRESARDAGAGLPTTATPSATRSRWRRKTAHATCGERHALRFPRRPPDAPGRCHYLAYSGGPLCRFYRLVERAIPDVEWLTAAPPYTWMDLCSLAAHRLS